MKKIAFFDIDGTLTSEIDKRLTVRFRKVPSMLYGQRGQTGI